MSKLLNRTRRGQKAKALIRKQRATRLVVFRSSTHLYAQITLVSPNGDKTLVACSTNDSKLRADLSGTKTEKAVLVGKELANRAIAKGITKVAFDRNGYKYSGRIMALANAAREAGLLF